MSEVIHMNQLISVSSGRYHDPKTLAPVVGLNLAVPGKRGRTEQISYGLTPDIADALAAQLVQYAAQCRQWTVDDLDEQIDRFLDNT